jgi:hypothetical protein
MTNPTPTDWRALCAELLADYDNCHYRSELSDRARAALAQPEPVALSPKEADAQEAFTQLRDEILHLSGPLEVNAVLDTIDYYTPKWV